MTTGKKYSVFAGILSILNLATVISCKSRQGDGIIIEPQAVDFGKIEGGTSISKTFTIKNESAHPAELRDIRASCGCTIVDWKPQLIPAHENASFTIRLTAPIGAFVGRKESIVAVEFRPNKIVKVFLTLDVTRSVALSPEDLDFSLVAGESFQFKAYVDADLSEKRIAIIADDPTITLNYSQCVISHASMNRLAFTVVGQVKWQNRSKIDTNICISVGSDKKIRAPLQLALHQEVELVNQVAEFRQSADGLVATFGLRTSQSPIISAHHRDKLISVIVKQIGPDFYLLQIPYDDVEFSEKEESLQLIVTSSTSTKSCHFPIRLKKTGLLEAVP